MKMYKVTMLLSRDTTDAVTISFMCPVGEDRNPELSALSFFGKFVDTNPGTQKTIVSCEHVTSYA